MSLKERAMQAVHDLSCEATSVLIVDSNQTQRQLLLRALRRRPEFKVAACGTEMDEILAAVTAANPQVAIMNADHDRDHRQDLSLVRRFHLTHPAIAKVLLIDGYERNMVVNAFRSGARGLFCFSDHPFRMLCKCIQSVNRGQVWANNQQLLYLIETITEVPSLRLVNANGTKLLTPREEQVVALVADGLSNKEVALELRLSEHTVKKYLFRIFDKLGISSRVELVLYAVSHGGRLQAEWMAGSWAV
jgi:DNA-binding NarL/FixJ family response regulator